MKGTPAQILAELRRAHGDLRLGPPSPVAEAERIRQGCR